MLAAQSSSCRKEKECKESVCDGSPESPLWKFFPRKENSRCSMSVSRTHTGVFILFIIGFPGVSAGSESEGVLKAP